MARSPEVIFEPEDLKLLGSAFDEAWAAVAVGLGSVDAEAQTESRARLANLMIGLASHQLDAEEIKRRAIKAFQQHSRDHERTASDNTQMSK